MGSLQNILLEFNHFCISRFLIVMMIVVVIVHMIVIMCMFMIMMMITMAVIVMMMLTASANSAHNITFNILVNTDRFQPHLASLQDMDKVRTTLRTRCE